MEVLYTSKGSQLEFPPHKIKFKKESQFLKWSFLPFRGQSLLLCTHWDWFYSSFICK